MITFTVALYQIYFRKLNWYLFNTLITENLKVQSLKNNKTKGYLKNLLQQFSIWQNLLKKVLYRNESNFTCYISKI